MIDFSQAGTLLNPASALVAGLVTSLHCVGMCGPLTFAWMRSDGGKGSVAGSSLLSYHGGKLIAYATAGALAGGLGGGFVSWVGASPAKIMPWAFVVFFAALLFEWDKPLSRLRVFGSWGRRVSIRAYRMKGWQRGLSLGLATPLLPCGPLYLAIWVAALAGSAGQGALALSMFGLGTAPALLASQLGWSWLASRRSPESIARWRKGIALAAIALLAARSFVDVGLAAVAKGEVCF